MPTFNFYIPIEVRYGDLDPQGHVNNAKYLTYIEQARICYVHQLGLWQGGSFRDLGIIMADAHITYRASIQFEQKIRVGACISRLGNKSMNMQNVIEDIDSGVELASASTTLVAYDYHSGKTIPIPERWRSIIAAFEHLAESGQ